MSLEDYTQTDLSEHQTAKQIIVAHLRRNARGRENAIPSRELAARTPVSASTVRDLIHEVRAEWGVPVDSAPAGGYFWITSADELQDCIERREDTIDTMQERIHELKAAWGGGSE